MIYELHIDGEVIETTEEHPFWIESEQEWIAVRNLEVGDKLTTKDGKQVAIHAIIVKEGITEVFNFEVEDFHTYFVGKNDIWTHNACRKPISPKKNIINQVQHGDGSITYTGKTEQGRIRDVTYNSAGYPDFSPYAIDQVDIEFTGNRRLDDKAAYGALGIKGKIKGYTWHHHENGKTMQLILTDIHDAFRHTGGYSIHKNERKN